MERLTLINDPKAVELVRLAYVQVLRESGFIFRRGFLNKGSCSEQVSGSRQSGYFIVVQ